MPVRVLLLSCAVAAVAWLAVGLHAVRAHEQARRIVYASHTLSPAEVRRARRLLHDATWGTPDQAPAVDGAALSARLRAIADTARRASAVVEREPANIEAWGWLVPALRRIDPARARAAAAQVRRLSPPVR